MTDTALHARSDEAAAQPRLDLPEPAQTVSAQVIQSPVRTKPGRKGLSPLTYGFVALAVTLALWGAWVTKSIIHPAVIKPPMASVRLEQLVGEYVQAQARSNAPPDQVSEQTQAFMEALGSELKSRGADGTTVLVGEAVLSQNVPDITQEVRAAIYAHVPAPQIAPPATMMPQPAPVMPQGASPMPLAAPFAPPVGQ